MPNHRSRSTLVSIIPTASFSRLDPMPLLTVSNLAHAYGANVVLDGATFAVDPGEKVGLVGRNGQGKTTLMKAVLGRLQPDSGQIQLQRGARVGYLSQDPDLNPDETLRDAAEGAFKLLHELHVKLNEVYDEMAGADSAQLDRLMKQQAKLEDQIEAAGGYAIDHKIDATLHGLGFTDDQFSLKVRKLSGGQKGRLALARLLLEQPDLLMLDEPTNHLDIAGREWLETFLAEEYPGAVILVSHDRWLLDRVVRRILEVERGRIWEYPGNYEKYLALKEERQLTEARVYDKQLDKIRQEEQFIRRYKTGQRAKQARGRQSRLDRFKRDELVERPVSLDVMKLNLPKAPRSGDQVVNAEGIGKRYGETVLFDRLDLSIARGERIGIIGPNGAGKTTLVKCLLDELEPDGGTVRLGSRLAVGYYRQLHENLDFSLTVWQYLQSVIVGQDGQSKASEQQARDLAGAFLFSGNDQEQALGDLSGGERSRAVLAGLVASAKNLLVLDEPTNHLDIPSAERLEQVLSMDGGYDGTLLLISHDRALLQATCDRLLIFDGQGGVRDFSGTFVEWHRRMEQENSARPTDESAPVPPARKDRSNANDGKKSSSNIRKVTERDVEKLAVRIEAMESRRTEIDAELADPEVYRDGERMRKLQQERQQLQNELEPIEEQWARAIESLE